MYDTIGELCGDVVCERGGECCMKCGRDGELVPSGRCANPFEDGKGCPLIHCEVPITRGPPIIIDPPGRKKYLIFDAYQYNSQPKIIS